LMDAMRDLLSHIGPEADDDDTDGQN